jgi:drug/metabolite transporter (DMT)-like permease
MSRRAWSLFVAVSLIWGIPYLFIKVAVDDGLTPAFVAWSRVTLAAIVLLPVAWLSGALRRLPLRWLGLFAIAEIVIPFPLIGLGEQRVSSSLAAIIVATEPLAVALLGLGIDRDERPSPIQLAGLLIGLAGVAALVGVDAGGRSDVLLGAGAVALATIGYAAGALMVKRRLSGTAPLGPVSVAMAIASFLLLPFGLADFPTQTPSRVALAALLILGVACSALAFILFFGLIALAGPSRATVITYVNPAVALAVGAAALSEPVTVTSLSGLLLVLAGSWLATDGRLPRQVRRPARPGFRDAGARAQELRPWRMAAGKERQ